MKLAEELLKELTALLRGIPKEDANAEKPKKKPLTIREIGLWRLAAMLAAGVFLLLLSFPELFPGNGGKEPVPEEGGTGGELIAKGGMDDVDAYVENAENRLEILLRKVEGVGNVEVMITVKSTGESIPLRDTPYEKKESRQEEDGKTSVENGESAEEETVMVETSDGTKKPYLVSETVPEIEGVAVIAQGGGNSEIKKEIVEAVQALFDIKAHKIKVMKMNE